MAKRSKRKERFLRIDLPENVRSIISVLEAAGFEAYAVGGCIRDSLLGVRPGDWDITTSARPAEIKAAFRRTVDTGIEHGTVTVLLGKCSYEVTTFRIDGEYKDGRHPSEVTFTGLLSEDLRRRDFTVNAMAYNEHSGLVDLFGGREDLKRGIIRCVGDPDERFNEDALRILRAVRFSAQLDFDIDAATRDAISVHAPRLRAVSKERVMTELTKLVCSAHIEKTADIFQLGIVPYVAKHFREINIAQLMGLKAAARKAAAFAAQQRDGRTAEPSLSPETADRVIFDAFDLCARAETEQRYIRFAMLTEGMAPAHIDELLRDLRADNTTRKNTVRLAECILQPLPADRTALKQQMSGMSPALFADLLRIKLASAGTMLYERDCASEDICAVIDLYNDIAAQAEPVYIPDLAVTGGDLLASGIREGPALGAALHELQAHVWAHPEDNTRERLLGLLKV